MIGIGGHCVVLDAAAGKGESALYLARAHGCRVVTLDLSGQMADESRRAARESPAGHLLSFVVGDAEELPFRSGSFDVLLCECSFSLLPRKSAAAREFHRVLRREGRIAIADFYLRTNTAPPASRPRLCPPGTETEETYRAIMRESGFHEIRFEDETERLKEHFLDLLLAPGSMESLHDKLPGRSERREHARSIGYCVATGTKG